MRGQDVGSGGEDAGGDVLFELKVIPFFGRDVSIILQNENGPCPLLAIANALLLRNQISLPARCASVGNVHIQQLLSIVAEHMLDANKETKQQQQETTEDVQVLKEAHLRMETIRQNISDAISILPKLLTGVDVNPKFAHCKGFEFTDEVAIFDLLDISLFHGWLYHPESEEAACIGQKSYNQVVEQIIHWDIQMSNQSEGKQNSNSKLAPMGAPPPPPSVEEVAPPITAVRESCDAERVKVSLEVLPGTSSPSTMKGEADLIDLSSDTENATTSTTEEASVPWIACSLDLTGDSLESKEEKNPPTETTTTTGTNQNQKNVEGDDSFGEKELHAYQVIQDFLQTSSSQLTTEGLIALQNEMKDRELAVFFRNNHFSTIFKHQNQLHLLMTDSGYRDLPLCVWETLTDVAGNTQIVDGTFGFGGTGGSTATNATVAHGLLEQQQQQQQEGQGLDQAGAVSFKAVDNMYTNQAGQISDADFALALQMQEEEVVYNEQMNRRREEEEKLALARRMQEEEQELHRRRMQQQQQQAASRSSKQKMKDKCSIM